MSEQINNNLPINGLLSADDADPLIFATVDAAVSAAAKAQLVFHDAISWAILGSPKMEIKHIITTG